MVIISTLEMIKHKSVETSINDGVFKLRIVVAGTGNVGNRSYFTVERRSVTRG